MNILIPSEHFEVFSVAESLGTLNELGFSTHELGQMAMELIRLFQNQDIRRVDTGHATQYICQRYNITHRINQTYDRWYGSCVVHMSMLPSIADLILELISHVLMIYRDIQNTLALHRLPYQSMNFLNINENGVTLNVHQQSYHRPATT